jgi:beta-lactamase superfamily II metal-dependent hydrolase
MPMPKFTFFAVEKGNSTLVEFDNGINMLVDCRETSSRPTPIEYLSARIKKLDILVVTHPHQDHICGLAELSDFYRPKHLWHCGRYFRPQPVFDDWSYYEKMRTGGFPYCTPKEVHAGVTCQIGSAEVRVLGPTKPFLEGTPEDVNNNGIILSVTAGNPKVVLTGDTQEEQWKAVDLRSMRGASVFLASHHGRESGFCDWVMNTIKPQRIIISDGEPCDTDATAKYGEFAPVSTTREHSIVVTAAVVEATVV